VSLAAVRWPRRPYRRVFNRLRVHDPIAAELAPGMTVSPQEKGDQLERAVRAIEQVILRDTPAYSDKTFRFRSKKIIETNGVHHEIDVWVEVDLGKGYDAVFIFECKNWEEKVSKNEIIVFQEKIRAANAQRGFFVARSFTKDAEAQAASDPRMELLRAEVLPIENVPTPFDFHWVNIQLVSVTPRAKGVAANGQPRREDVDPHDAGLLLNGAQLDVDDYFRRWADEAAVERIKSFHSEHLAEGIYALEAHAERTYAPGELTMKGDNITRQEIDVAFTVRVIRPGIVSHLSVEGRGRVVEVGPAHLFGGELRALFTTLEGDPSGRKVLTGVVYKADKGRRSR